MRTLGTRDGDLDFTVVDGLESVKQRIVQRLLFWRGEWFLDTSKGIPYLPRALVRRGSSPLLLRQVITDAIEEVDGVVAVRDIEVTYQAAERRILYVADIEATEGLIEALQVLSPALPFTP